MSALPDTLPHFRRMRVVDLEFIAEQEASAYEYPWTRGNFKDALDAGYDCWLMLVGSQIIGHAIVLFAASEAHLLNLTVAPSWQRRGYGRILLQHLINEAKPHKAELMLLEVRPSNVGALQLYAAFSFDQIGLRRNYYPRRGGGHEDAWVLSLVLVDPLAGKR
jgi:[ribosomal protein S18]-alanine N-acetyltransferase